MTSTTTAKGLASELAAFVNRDTGNAVWPALDAGNHLYFNIGHEFDVTRDGADWEVREHDVARCRGCVACAHCGAVARATGEQFERGTRLPDDMAEVIWRDALIKVCADCLRGGVPDSDLDSLARLAALEDPWPDSPF